MPEVDFEEQDWLKKKGDEEEAENPKMVEFLLNKGVAKTSKQANYMIGGAVVAGLIIALVVFAIGKGWL